MANDADALTGAAEPAETEQVLRAGPITALLVAGALRDIRWNGTEVIRNVAFLVRDRSWATVVPEITDLTVQEDASRFSVAYRARGVLPADGTRIGWTMEISGHADDGIVLRVAAEPEGDITTNRTGFVVLHPLDGTVGCPVTVEHSDGRVEQSRFPDLIDPLQPLMDVRALTHAPLPGLLVTCRMDGDVWETEDHRNWLDASFKTYGRPLALPWPYVLPPGQTLRQEVRISFTVTGAAAVLRAPRSEAVTIVIGDRTGLAMPQIGLAVDASEIAECLAAAEHVAGLGAQALAIRLRSDAHDKPGLLRQAARVAARLGAEPVLEIVIAPDHTATEGLDLVAVAAASAGLRPAAAMVSPGLDLASYPPSTNRPAGAALADIYAAARSAFPGVKIGGGMFGFFTEVNRRRPPVALLDFLQHSTAAVVHAADDRSVMETLETLPHVIRSARALAGATPYWIGPANIALATNPNDAAAGRNPKRQRLTLATEDPRAAAPFGAAYAAGFLARAAAGGVERVTMMSPAGRHGVVAADGTPVPAWHVLALFAAHAGTGVVQAASASPREVLAAAWVREGRREAVIANITASPQAVSVAGLSPRQVRSLGAGARGWTGLASMDELPPYAVLAISE